MIRFAARVLRIVALVYAGLFAVLFTFQNQFIYFPSKAPEFELLWLADQNGLKPWRDDSGALIGWKSVHSGTLPRTRMVLFHGNAGFALHREAFVKGLQSLERGELWEVYLFEYPGYGARPGKPGEAVFVEAARGAIEQLRRGDSRPLFVAGESVGGGVASSIAGQFSESISGVLLITPFTTLADAAAFHYPFFPVRVLLRDLYDNVKALKDYHGAVAVVLAGKDEVVPAALGRRLYDTCIGRKRLWVQDAATHNTIDYSPRARWWREASDFLTANTEPPR
jgi:pimeloyl-ACP methyl ester carboxylesterase